MLFSEGSPPSSSQGPKSREPVSSLLFNRSVNSVNSIWFSWTLSSKDFLSLGIMLFCSEGLWFALGG